MYRRYVGLSTALVAAAFGAGCSADPSPRPSAPPTLVVRAVGTAGPVKDVSGPGSVVGQIQGALTTRMLGVLVLAEGPSGVIKARTDRKGVARFAVPPGRYSVRLAETKDCDAGANTIAITVAGDATANAQVTCEQP